MNNYDKTFVYDERPSFESYNSMNMQYPSMPMMPVYPGNMMMPNMNNNSNSYNNLESRVSTLEKKVQCKGHQKLAPFLIKLIYDLLFGNIHTTNPYSPSCLIRSCFAI